MNARYFTMVHAFATALCCFVFSQRRSRWTAAEDRVLLEVITAQTSRLAGARLASQYFDGLRSTTQCYKRFMYLRRTRGERRWTPEELAALRHGMEAHGMDAAAIRSGFLPHRQVEQVRKRLYSMRFRQKKALQKRREELPAHGGVKGHRAQRVRDLAENVAPVVEDARAADVPRVLEAGEAIEAHQGRDER